MSNPEISPPPNAPYGSQERMQYWQNYWNSWGSSNETHRELAGMIQDFESDILIHENAIEKYKQYKDMEVPGNWDDAIATATDTINHLKAAIQQTEAEFTNALASVGKQ